MKKNIRLVIVAFILTGALLITIDYSPNTEIIALGQAGTSVGGILWDNSTWTLANSPYTITSTVQIPENVTLTIEPGVAVNTQINDDMFLLKGIIIAQGTVDEQIVFDGGNTASFFNAEYANAESFLDMDNCIVKNGKTFWWGGGGNAHLNLTNSELTNLSGYSYIRYPEKDVLIAYNVFIDNPGFTIANNVANISFTNNLFIGNTRYIIENAASYGSSETIVKYNSFINTTGIVLQLRPGYSTANMTAVQNYWGTNDTNVIDAMIYDKNDDITCANFINYMPILAESHPDTPSLPPATTDDYDSSWKNSDFTINLDASDEDSGIAETYYKINSGSIQTVSANGHPYITTEGSSNTLEYWSVDNQDNEELPHKLLTGIKLDKTAPTGSISINNNAPSTTSSSVTLSLTSADALSGVHQVRYSNDGSWDSEPWETPSSTKAWTLTSGDGIKTVYYQIQDNAGLESPTYSNTITLSTPTPTPTPSPTPSPAPTAEPTPTPPATPTPSSTISPSPTPSPPPEETPIILYIGIAIAVVIAIVLVAVLRFRK